jgi:O-antigen/teichoic acid export membrane protein
MTNALGYAKLLHRSADVLLVGFFCGDYHAGLYRCARSATDTLFAVNDVLAKTYQPRLFRLAAERDATAFRALARHLLLTMLGLAAVGVAAELILLPVLVPFVFGAVFAGAVPAMILLTVPVMWAFAVNLWAWPLLITFTSLGAYTAISFVAVIAGQYVIALAGHGLFGLGALPFAVGHAAVFVLLHGAVLGLVRRRLPAFSPV